MFLKMCKAKNLACVENYVENVDNFIFIVIRNKIRKNCKVILFTHIVFHISNVNYSLFGA